MLKCHFYSLKGSNGSFLGNHTLYEKMALAKVGGKNISAGSSFYPRMINVIYTLFSASWGSFLENHVLYEKMALEKLVIKIFQQGPVFTLCC